MRSSSPRKAGTGMPYRTRLFVEWENEAHRFFDEFVYLILDSEAITIMIFLNPVV